MPPPAYVCSWIRVQKWKIKVTIRGNWVLLLMLKLQTCKHPRIYNLFLRNPGLWLQVWSLDFCNRGYVPEIFKFLKANSYLHGALSTEHGRKVRWINSNCSIRTCTEHGWIGTRHGARNRDENWELNKFKLSHRKQYIWSCALEGHQWSKLKILH